MRTILTASAEDSLGHERKEHGKEKIYWCIPTSVLRKAEHIP